MNYIIYMTEKYNVQVDWHEDKIKTYLVNTFIKVFITKITWHKTYYILFHYVNYSDIDIFYCAL